MKEHKTADCVVIGVRWKVEGERLATLLLGLYRDDGGIDYVGSAAVAREDARRVLGRVSRCSTTAFDRRFSEPNRWGGGELEESPLRPELVVEVRYDKVQGNRFRHGTRLLRFRADKDAEQCTWRELRPARGRTTRRSRHSSLDASSPAQAERDDGDEVREAGERAELRRTASRRGRAPTPRAHMTRTTRDQHDPGQRRRVAVEPLESLVAAVAAQPADRLAAAAEQRSAGPNATITPSAPEPVLRLAADPERGTEREPERDREQRQEPPAS